MLSRYSCIAITVLAITFLSNETLASNDLALPPLNQLDAWLDESESKFANLRTGTEKKIFWNNQSEKSISEWAVVYLHGFSASRREISPVVESLGQRLKANVFFTRFTGHGLIGGEMGDAKFKNWQMDALEAYQIGRKIGNKVIVVGTSTGATMALWLADQLKAEEHSLEALILASPNFAPADDRTNIFLYPFGTLMAKMIDESHHGYKPDNPEHSYFWTTYFPIEAIAEMMKAVDYVDKSNLEALKIPILMLYTPKDRVVSVEKILSGYDRIGSSYKSLKEVKKAKRHVLAGDILSPESNDEVATLIDEFLKSLQ